MTISRSSYDYQELRMEMMDFLETEMPIKIAKMSTFFMISFSFSLQMYVCEECGHTTNEPEVHYIHLKDLHPYSPALLKFYDKRHFKFTNSTFANNLLGQLPMPVHN